MKILFPTTRDLCYFSADFFADRMTKALQKQGVEVVRLPLPETIVDGKPVTADFFPLEKYEGQAFDAILDINSKLPYLEAEPGVRYLDTFDAPFLNILLDHPLYHHPGLAFRLKRYYTVCIDHRHQAYVDSYYPWIIQNFYLPLAGTPAAEAGESAEAGRVPADGVSSPAAGGARPDAERIPRLLFPGTFEPETCLYEEVAALPDWAAQIVKDLYGVWNPEEEPMEAAVSAYLSDLPVAQTEKIFVDFGRREKAALEDFLTEAAGDQPLLSKALFPVVMNYLYPLDRLTRFAMRKRVVTALADAGASLDIQGEGWETTGIFDRLNVRAVDPMPIGPAIEKMAKYRAVLDINPDFYAGLHDRVSTALINGCLTFSNMSVETAPDTPLLRHYSSYNTDALCEMVLEAQKEGSELTRTDAAEAGSTGRKAVGSFVTEDAAADAYPAYPLTWDKYAGRLAEIIDRCNT